MLPKLLVRMAAVSSGANAEVAYRDEFARETLASEGESGTYTVIISAMRKTDGNGTAFARGRWTGFAWESE